MTNQTDVLIIGGGFAGVAVAQKLAQNKVDVTLIDTKDYFEVTFATLRNVANPKMLGDTARKQYRDFIAAKGKTKCIASIAVMFLRFDSKFRCFPIKSDFVIGLCG